MSDTEGFTMVEEVQREAIREPIEPEKDETYYWADPVRFLVGGVIFRVSRYPFVLGSRYFAEKHGLLAEAGPEAPAQPEGVTPAQFRVFLKFMFPVHLTSITTTFTKEEWLTILTLSVQWHFYEARKLAIEHLDLQLTDVESILFGRAAYVPRWVARGYTALINSPLDDAITEEAADEIGHREVNRLWAIRCRQLTLVPRAPGYVTRELSSKFSDEFAKLAAREWEYRTIAELQEQEELEREKLRIEEEEERRRIDDEETQRLYFEDEARKRQEVEYDLPLRLHEERGVEDEEQDTTEPNGAQQGCQRLENPERLRQENERVEIEADEAARRLSAVDGFLFKVPRYQFIAGSEFFATKYLHTADQPQDDWSTVSGESDSEFTSKTIVAARGVVVLEEVTAPEFRTFLKLLFPIHSTSTTLTLTKSEWLTILTLATRWHFLDLRGLAIRHLHCQMSDPIEMIQVGRACYVLRWVTAGYTALIEKPGAISEEESEAIGDRTAVRLYIIRHELKSSPANYPTDTDQGGPGRRLYELLSSRFTGELQSLKSMEGQRKTEADTTREKEEAEEVERLRAEEAKEAERLRMEEEEKLRKAEEAERLAVEEIARKRREEAMKRAEEEAKLVAKRKAEDDKRKSEAKKAEEARSKAKGAENSRPRPPVPPSPHPSGARPRGSTESLRSLFQLFAKP